MKNKLIMIMISILVITSVVLTVGYIWLFTQSQTNVEVEKSYINISKQIQN